jgi:hypothetical protein
VLIEASRDSNCELGFRVKGLGFRV